MRINIQMCAAFIEYLELIRMKPFSIGTTPKVANYNENNQLDLVWASDHHNIIIVLESRLAWIASVIFAHLHDVCACKYRYLHHIIYRWPLFARPVI